MMKNESNFLIYGIIVGSIIGAGIFVYFTSKFIRTTNTNLRERRHKFFEGLDDIFEDSAMNIKDNDTSIDKETETEIIDELFSRTN